MTRQDIQNTVDEIAMQLKTLTDQMDPIFDLDFSRDMNGITTLDGKLWVVSDSSNNLESKVFVYKQDGT